MATYTYENGQLQPLSNPEEFSPEDYYDDTHVNNEDNRWHWLGNGTGFMLLFFSARVWTALTRRYPILIQVEVLSGRDSILVADRVMAMQLANTYAPLLSLEASESERFDRWCEAKDNAKEPSSHACPLMFNGIN